MDGPPGAGVYTSTLINSPGYVFQESLYYKAVYSVMLRADSKEWGQLGSHDSLASKLQQGLLSGL